MQKINTRLEAIAQRLAQDSAGQALLALGSAGIEIERADKYSDIDFFAIVADGEKSRFLDDVTWLNADSKVVWIFQNTSDGFKLLWEDGLFGEMAVFEISELPGIAFSPGRVIWQRPELPPTLLTPTSEIGIRPQPRDFDFLAAELLSNLYIGLGRFLRGERLSGWRFIQGHAFGLALEIIELQVQPRDNHHPDRYNFDRRFELRFPEYRNFPNDVLLGINQTIAAAEHLLNWLSIQGLARNALVVEVEQLITEAKTLRVDQHHERH